jgi:hypothetical protein
MYRVRSCVLRADFRRRRVQALPGWDLRHCRRRQRLHRMPARDVLLGHGRAGPAGLRAVLCGPIFGQRGGKRLQSLPGRYVHYDHRSQRVVPVRNVRGWYLRRPARSECMHCLRGGLVLHQGRCKLQRGVPGLSERDVFSRCRRDGVGYMHPVPRRFVFSGCRQGRHRLPAVSRRIPVARSQRIWVLAVRGWLLLIGSWSGSLPRLPRWVLLDWCGPTRIPRVPAVRVGAVLGRSRIDAMPLLRRRLLLHRNRRRRMQQLLHRFLRFRERRLQRRRLQRMPRGHLLVRRGRQRVQRLQ